MRHEAIRTAAPIRRVAPDLGDLLARIAPIAEEIAHGAAQRDIDRTLPFEAFALIKQAGLGALRIPKALGGPGGSVRDYIGMIVTLGAADSNVAHALRSHFNFTEELLLAPNGVRAQDHLGHVLEGKLFGAAHTELGTRRPGDVTTRLSGAPGAYRLNGRKWYATGTAFADFAVFSALDNDEQLVRVTIPTNREGVTVLDDWDGMGQKLTASGGVLLENVEVLPHEVALNGRQSDIGRHTSTLRQLHLAASAAGAVRAALREGMDYVRGSARSAAHSGAESPPKDPFVQKVVGEIAARSFAIDAMIFAAADALDRSVAAMAVGDRSAVEAALIESSLTTSRTQIVLADLGLKAAEQIFELGGGSATSRTLNLDRHWRNIRTVLNHNPLLHKARVVGDYYLNGTTTEFEQGRVF